MRKLDLILLFYAVLFCFHVIFLVSGWVAAKDLDINNCINDSPVSAVVDSFVAVKSPEDKVENGILRGLANAAAGSNSGTYYNDATRVHIFGLNWVFLVFLLTLSWSRCQARAGFSKTSLGFLAGVQFCMANWFLVMAVDAGHILVDKKYNEGSLYTRSYVETKAISALLLCVLYGVLSMLLLSWEEQLVFVSPYEKRFRESLDAYENEEVLNKPGSESVQGGSQRQSMEIRELQRRRVGGAIRISNGIHRVVVDEVERVQSPLSHHSQQSSTGEEVTET